MALFSRTESVEFTPLTGVGSLLKRDGTGSRWAVAVLVAWGMSGVFYAMFDSHYDELHAYPATETFDTSLMLWALLLLVVLHAVVPTILGWALLVVPVFLWTLRVVRAPLLGGIGDWFGYAYYCAAGISASMLCIVARPKRASGRLVTLSLVIAAVVETPLLLKALC